MHHNCLCNETPWCWVVLGESKVAQTVAVMVDEKAVTWELTARCWAASMVVLKAGEWVVLMAGPWVAVMVDEMAVRWDV